MTRAARLLTAVAICILAGGCAEEQAGDGKVHLVYWEKWTDFEADAMRQVVEAFNRSQDRILVEYVHVAQPERKAIVATAGGDPPDICGLYAWNVCPLAERHALVTLDEYLQSDGLTAEHWLPIYFDAVQYKGHVWAIPSAPTAVALYWNKDMFRAAGLDPDRPPETLAELEEYNRRLTRYDERGRIVQMGYMPDFPTWVGRAYPQWFGGQLFEGDRITADHPANIEAFRWVQSYLQACNPQKIQEFRSGFGVFASAQNPFFCDKLAMVLQGVWMPNFIEKYGPGMDWGAGPWPRTPNGPEKFTMTDQDVLVLLRGCRHPDEAWEFLRFVSTQEGMEMLCLGQRKNTPLSSASEGFWAHHPHPAIEVFDSLARSPSAIHHPKLPIGAEYHRELDVAFDRIRHFQTTPEQALADVQQRISARHRQLTERLALRSRE